MKRPVELPTSADIEREDERAVRAHAAKHGGSIEISGKVIELNFPADADVKSKNFMASNWHNLRAVALGEGRVKFG